MIKNNNREVIGRMAKRNLKSNRRRSITMIFAVMLATFLLFSVFTVGATYLNMQRLLNIRLNGADFDAVLYGMTPEQKELLEKNEEVKQFGIVTLAGAVKETEMDQTPGVGLLYADETLWNDMMAPARSYTQGSYPMAENEIMVTKKALEKCGYPDKEIGDEITFVYETEGRQAEKTFQISGIWDGYGDTAQFYVAKAFCTKEQIDELYHTRCDISFQKKWMSQEQQQAFIDQLNLKKSQRLLYVYEYANTIEIFLGLAGIMFVTCLSAYLLIYNIMYLSVAGNIRYYGLLQTIGMTAKQIKQFMKRQMIWIGGTGIALGLLLGSSVSFVLIPVVVESLGIRQGRTGKIQVFFHPAIFLLTIAIASMTVWYAARKPIHAAAVSSPIEALGYRPVSARKRSRKTRKGNLIRRMAMEQLTRNRKKTGITMLSLAASLSMFVCLVTLLHTQSAREFVFHYMGLDMAVRNDTIQNVYAQEKQLKGIKQILTDDLLEQIRHTQGVKEVLPVSYASLVIPWEPEVADVWMREFYETWMYIPYEDDIEEYKEKPENFASSLVGITETDFHALNAELEKPVDEQAFLNGKACILYRNGLFGLKDSDIIGKTIHCAEYGNTDHTCAFEIGALTDIDDYTALLGFTPTVIVIDQAVADFVREPVIFKAGIRYDQAFDEAAEHAVQKILMDSPDAKDYSFDSKIEEADRVKQAQGHMMEVGMGIAAILAVIGLMNYVNTSAGNMHYRRKEISMIESVGMTEHQVRKMLIWEGVLYTSGVIFLTLTAGLGITYGIYQTLNYMDADFWFPVFPFLGAAALLLAVCTAVPLLAYQRLKKSGSLVERIRVEAE